MIERTKGDILQAEVEALVNTVNCVGIMGRGIALQFRRAFPRNYDAYREACEKGLLQPGRMFICDLDRTQNPRIIVNFPTKRHWKGKSRIEDIRAGLRSLVQEVRDRNVHSIAVPALGCGLGGLDWATIRPLVEAAFRDLPDVRVVLYEPAGAPVAEKMVQDSTIPKMTAGRAALLGLMRRYLSAVLDPFVSLLEIHKLLYFMQEAGEPLRLRYAKGLYGPYADNLRHVLSRIEGHYIRGYGDAEDRPDKQIELLPGAWEQAEAVLRGHSRTLERFERVAELIKGFETAFGLELLATVHWVATRDGAKTPEAAVAATYAWNRRKRMFESKHIRIAWGVLSDWAWIPPGR